MSKYPALDAKKIVRPILRNYNRHVLRFVRLLESISCRLSYEGPSDVRDHVRNKTVYACSVRCYSENASDDNKKKVKSLKCVFPVMIGSDLDHCIRKRGLRLFSKRDLTSVDFLDDIVDDASFHLADIACTFFLINGCVRQLPYFFTNDPTNTHVVRGRKLVRCYTYDADDRGKEMSYYAANDPCGKYMRGDIAIVLNDGTVVLNDERRRFFEHCPYRTEQAPYMAKVYRDGQFDIDHLANKVVVSPGHLFAKLFLKYLFQPLKKREWSTVKSKLSLVVKSIETGSLLHVLSKKTTYFKDNASTMTVVNNVCSSGGRSESGGIRRDLSNDVYVEKNTGCYREVNMQTYPLNPQLSHLITRQISSKVKRSNIVAYHPSYLGFLCLVGTFETKNVGRTGTMVRHTVVATREDVRLVYETLNLESAAKKDDPFYVVVNEACIPVTRACFESIDLERVKRKLKFVECYSDANFVMVRKKIGLFYKKLMYFEDPESEKRKLVRTIWVTARDETYWKERYVGRLLPVDYDRLTGYLADLNPFFNHNVFTKNILAFNTLKNAVLSTDPRYSEYFLESLSVYTSVTPRHRVLCRPVDAFSSRFALFVPLLTVAYVSFKGLNQEDCIVVDRNMKAFDSRRFHTVRLKFESPSRFVTFHPTSGDVDPECYLLGHLVCHDVSLTEFRVSTLTMHAKLEALRGRKAYRVYFNKPGFRIVSFDISDKRMAVCLVRSNASKTGNKLSSFHGQKGVSRTSKKMPSFAAFDEFGNEWRIVPDLLVNPYCSFRQTGGQFREGLHHGGADLVVAYNSDGRRISTDFRGIFVAPTYYFAAIYFSAEHNYAPDKCTIDLILGQPVKGRSRLGGMKISYMEISLCCQGNGLASTFGEKAFEHGDRYFHLEPVGKKRTAEDDDCGDCESLKRRKIEDGRKQFICRTPPARKKRSAEEDDSQNQKRKKITEYNQIPDVSNTRVNEKRFEHAETTRNFEKKKIKNIGRTRLAVPIPKSATLCKEELLFWKCLMEFKVQSCLKEIKD